MVLGGIITTVIHICMNEKKNSLLDKRGLNTDNYGI